MTSDDRVEALFARYVEHHVIHGTRARPEELCEECPKLLAPLRKLIQQYELVDKTLTASVFAGAPQSPVT